MSAITNASPQSNLSRCLSSPSRHSPVLARKGISTGKRPSVALASKREPSSKRDDRVVEQTRTYNESDGKIYSRSVPPEDDEGSIALLVPGGRVSDRPSQAGGAAAAARREQSKPLKINTDLRLV